MKKATFAKADIIELKNPPSNHLAVWVDSNNVFTTLDSSGNHISLGSLININNQTGSNYSLVSTDGGKIIEMNNASPNSITVPDNSTVSFQTGTQILISQYGSGETSLTWSGSVVVRSSGGKIKLNGQYSAATLLKRDTDEWYLFGDITS